MKWMRRLLVLTILGLLGLYPLLAPPAHRIDQAHCDRIKEGMTRQQVEGIFGVPAGDYDWAEADQRRLLGYYAVVVKNWERVQGARRRYELALDELAAVPQHDVVYEVPVDTSLNGDMVLPVAFTHARWTGRHGSFTIWFDEHDRVTSGSHAGEVKIVPPWQRWWRKYSGK